MSETATAEIAVEDLQALLDGSTELEQYQSVCRAIAAIEERGQRYTIKDRELWRGDLKALYAERARLEPAAKSAAAAMLGAPPRRRVYRGRIG